MKDWGEEVRGGDGREWRKIGGRQMGMPKNEEKETINLLATLIAQRNM